MSNRAKNQHYIPQFYLRNFRDKNGKIAVYYKEKNKLIETEKAKNFATERSFYDSDQEELKLLLKDWIDRFPDFNSQIDFSLNQYIEYYLGNMEDAVAKLFKKINENPKELFKIENKLLIINFIYTLAYRTSPYRSTIENKCKEYLSYLKNQKCDEKECNKKLEEIGMSKGARYYQLRKIFSIPNLLHFGKFFIFNYIWYFANVEGDLGLITSDNPAFGFDIKLYDICFPISPKNALIFKSRFTIPFNIDLSNDSLISISSEEVVDYNRINLCNANPYKFAFGTCEDIKSFFHLE